MKTSEALIGKEPLILQHYGLPPITNNKHVNCPICGKTKKYRSHIRDGKFSYICVCGAGGIFALLEQARGLDFKTAASEIDVIIGNRQEYKPKPTSERPSIEQQTITRFQALENKELIKEYLLTRGIYTMPKFGVKGSRSEWDNDENRSFNCMFSLATDQASNIGFVHKTYLENGVKANIEKQKKLFTINEYAESVAVRMFQCDTVLGISEGIESALSASQMYQLPVWSTLNTSITKKFRAPSGVKKLIVYADNDRNGAGLAAAFECAHRNILANNDVEKVIVKWPEFYDKDFNDMLNEPMKTFEWVLEK